MALFGGGDLNAQKEDSNDNSRKQQQTFWWLQHIVIFRGQEDDFSRTTFPIRAADKLKIWTWWRWSQTLRHPEERSRNPASQSWISRTAGQQIGCCSWGSQFPKSRGSGRLTEEGWPVTKHGLNIFRGWTDFKFVFPFSSFLWLTPKFDKATQIICHNFSNFWFTVILEQIKG